MISFMRRAHLIGMEIIYVVTGGRDWFVEPRLFLS